MARSVAVRTVGSTAKFSKTMLEAAYGREMNIQFSGNRSGGHPCSQSACQLQAHSKHETSVTLCCDKTAHFRVAFYCPQHEVHLCNDHVAFIFLLSFYFKISFKSFSRHLSV